MAAWDIRGGASGTGPATSGPATAGALLLNFGGINLGNQDIPLNAPTTASANQAPIIGNPPTAFLTGLGAATAGSGSILLIIGAALLAWFVLKK